MAKYFVITRAYDVNDVNLWNHMRTTKLKLLCIFHGDIEWIMWEVMGDELLPLVLEPWVKSVRMISE